MSINKDTKLCISIAKNAGNFGTTLYNHVFNIQSMNYIYKSFSITDLKSTIAGVKALDIRGMSVTMPYKTAVLKYVDVLSEEVKAINASNTIVNEAGVLKAYNTDVDSAKILLREAKDKKKLYILGNGGYAKSVRYAAKDIFEEIITVTRDNWDDIYNIKTGTIFNCTPVKKITLNNTDVSFIDCDTNSETGKRLAVLQAARQFYLYTGCQFPTNYILKNLEEILKNNESGIKKIR